MLLEPRIRKSELIELCRRLAMQIEAGIEMRAIWKREIDRFVSPTSRRVVREISRALDQGQSLSDAAAAAGTYFPPLFLRMLKVGETTGALPEALRLLADYYEEERSRRALFWKLLAWPLTELVLAIGVIGFLIWVMGIIGNKAGGSIDPLGFGLVGDTGLAIYLFCVAALAGGIAWAAYGWRRGWLSLRPLQRLVLRLPVLGRIAHTLALARMTWTMYATFRGGMDVISAVDLALQTADNAAFDDLRPMLHRSLQSGNSLYQGFAETHFFPGEWLDALRAGEESGTLDAALDGLSREYTRRAASAMKTLSIVGAGLVMALIVGVMVFLIFRLAMFYIGQIYENLPA
ncbi:MAG: hypothetical protein GYA33_01550 [Thermogutta sp.]|nr:hypothetical protein [Thermogutta sp.]